MGLRSMDNNFDKHIENIERCKTHNIKMEKRYSRIRDLELLYSIFLVVILIYDMSLGLYFICFGVIWLFVVHRNSFYSDWKHSERNLQAAEDDYKYASHIYYSNENDDNN